MKFVKALKDKVIVEILRPEERTEGGIIIPATVEKDPQGYGRVLSVGEEVTTIKEGEIILFAKFGGQDIMIDNKIMKVLVYPEVYGVLEEKTKATVTSIINKRT